MSAGAASARTVVDAVAPAGGRRRWPGAVAAVLAVFAALLFWLYLRSQALSPAQHFAYAQNMRDLRELDARITGELLANRLEQARNYDAVTGYLGAAEAAAGRLAAVPAYLDTTGRADVQAAAARLQGLLERKADLVDRFKRDNAVLRNSRAYFPVATADFLDRADASVPTLLRDDLEGYARDVLRYANVPGEANSRAVDASRARLVAALHTPEQRHRIDLIVRHGDLVVRTIPALESILQDVVTLGSEQQLEAVNRAYGTAYLRAQAVADAFRQALFALSIVLTSFIAWLFYRLDRTHRSLAQAHREVSERYAAQQVAEKKLMLHATAFGSANDGIMLTDADGLILDVNPSFSRITGWSRADVLGRNPRLLKSGRHDNDFYRAMWASIRETGSWRGEIWNRNKYGETYPELLSISAVHDAGGQLTNYVSVFSDIGRIKAQERQLTQLAYYDALTELPNRALLADRIVLAIAQTRRSNNLMAVCYLDLDGFKPINDTWGHDAGDAVLVDIARRLNGALRGGDTVARLGGDEFVLLLLGLASTAECDEAVRRLLQLIEEPLTLLPEPVAVTASIGVTLFPDDDADPETLLRHADQAMYKAKQSGRNCFHLFDSALDRSARSLHDRVARLRQALEEHELLLYFQPKVDMRQGTVIGAEALIRWAHPERGLLEPAEFLPLIEGDEMAKLIGDWVIESALMHMESWRWDGLELSVSVNLAAAQLQAPEFVDKLRAALLCHATVAHQLELEILETAALEDIAKTVRVIEECRRFGVHFSLDDFGTGYSSLSYLKRIPADTLKIDQSFVREVLGDYNSLVIVQGIIGLARAFQRQIVAEGVETVEHGRVLLQLGCDLAQGFGIARPMPAQQIPGWVRAWRPDTSWQAIGPLRWESADQQILTAEIQLRTWVLQFVHAAGDPLGKRLASIEPLPALPFGQWYFGPGRARYQEQPAYLGIEPHLRRLHELAAEIERRIRTGSAGAPSTLIPELLAERDYVMAGISALMLAVAVTR